MIKGRVIHGDGIGKSQGYATANLDIGPERTQLKAGCYATWAKWRGQRHPAALIVASQATKVEVYLLDYVGPDFYGEEMAVDPIQKVSEVVHADSLPELKAKMDEDLRQIRKILHGS